MDVEARIIGLAALLDKERTFGSKVEGPLTEALHKVGEKVAADVRQRYEPYSAVGAEGVQEKVLASGLWVVQTRTKSRNPKKRRPNFGPLMWDKAFGPAASDNADHVLEAAEAAVQEAAALYWNT